MDIEIRAEAVMEGRDYLALTRFMTGGKNKNSIMMNILLLLIAIVGVYADFKVNQKPTIITIVAVIAAKNPGLALILLLALPLFAAFTRRVQRRMLAAQLDNRRAVAAVSGQVPETLHNIRTIRALGMEQYMERRYDRCIGAGYAAMERTNFYDAVYSPVVLLLNAVVVGIVMLLSASGSAVVLELFGMSVGTSVAVINYISRIFAPIESLGMEVQTIQSAMAGVKRIDAFLAQPEREISAQRTRAARGDVELSHVTFGYGEKHVLNDFSMTVKQGEQVTLIGRTGAGKSTVFKLLLGRQVDGILIVPQSSKSYDNLKSYLDQVPTVFLSENLRSQPQSYVAVDNSRGTYLGTQYLYELGHRDILYFGQRPGSTTHQLRADGYMKACHEFDLTPHFFNSEYSRSSIQGGYQLAKELFRKPLDCTAVFAATDSNALGILTAADEMGIDIPGHLSLIGFDNISATALSRIDLTTVDQPKRDMAVQAVDMLRDKIENGTQGYVHQILLPTLIQRGTCRKLEPSK